MDGRGSFKARAGSRGRRPEIRAVFFTCCKKPALPVSRIRRKAPCVLARSANSPTPVRTKRLILARRVGANGVQDRGVPHAGTRWFCSGRNHLMIEKMNYCCHTDVTIKGMGQNPFSLKESPALESITGQSVEETTDVLAWFPGDRRLFSIDGPIGASQGGPSNPNQVMLGDRVELPRTVRETLMIEPSWQFVVTELRFPSRGPIGFCEIRSQPGRGVWVQLRYLSHAVPLIQGPRPRARVRPRGERPLKKAQPGSSRPGNQG